MGSANTQATRSTLQSVDTTLSENINATQNYIPVASTTNFSTSVVAEIESTNEVVSFTDISENRIGNSSTWSGAGWQSPLRQTRTSNAGTAPDGTNTAFSLVPDSSNNTHRQDIAPVINGGMLNSTTYAISIFAKANGYTGLSIGLSATSNIEAGNTPKTVYFNLATGTVSFTGSSITSSSVEDFGDGWYRCKIVATTPASFDASNPDRLLFGIGEDESTFSYLGNTTDGILLWGPQIEQKSTHSTYIPNDNVNPVYGLTNVTRGVNGTTAQAASSGDSIQQLPYAFQGVTTNGSSTLSENIDASQDYIPVASTSGFATGVNATIESTNEVVSFGTITENLFLHSQDFKQTSYWQYNNSNIQATLQTAPDGTTTANGFREDSSSVSHNIIRNSLTTVIGQKYTLSIFAKWVGKRYLQLNFGGGDSNPNLAYQNFDVETGVLGSSSGVTNSAITDVGNGWYRCSTVVESAVTTGFIPVFSLIPTTTSGRAPFYTGEGFAAGAQLYIWGAQLEEGDSLTGYLPTTSSSLQGLTNVTRGVNGTTAASALSGATISQEPSLTFLGMPVRLKAISVSPDGTGNARLTLCDNNGDALCDVDTPDAKSYTLNMPEKGIVFPNGVFVSNTDNITAYTVYTEKYSGPGLTS